MQAHLSLAPESGLTQRRNGGWHDWRADIASQTQSMVTTSAAARPCDYTVLIDCALPGDQQRRQLVRQTWRHNLRMRKLVFIQPMTLKSR